MWPLLKMFALKHYTVNNIQSLIYTQMYNRFIVIEKEELHFCQTQNPNLIHAGVSQGYLDQFNVLTFSKAVAFG